MYTQVSSYVCIARNGQDPRERKVCGRQRWNEQSPGKMSGKFLTKATCMCVCVCGEIRYSDTRTLSTVPARLRACPRDILMGGSRSFACIYSNGLKLRLFAVHLNRIGCRLHNLAHCPCRIRPHSRAPFFHRISLPRGPQPPPNPLKIALLFSRPGTFPVRESDRASLFGPGANLEATIAFDLYPSATIEFHNESSTSPATKTSITAAAVSAGRTIVDESSQLRVLVGLDSRRSTAFTRARRHRGCRRQRQRRPRHTRGIRVRRWEETNDAS